MSTALRGRLSVLAVSSLAIAGMSTPAYADGDPSPSSTVTGHNGWVEQAYENSPGGGNLDPQQSEVDGPQRTPFGTGSHQIRIGQSGTQTELYRTPAYDGTPLSDLTRLEYSSYAKSTSSSGDLRQPTYLRLNVDNDADGTRDESLYFFPANNSDQHPVANGEWQDWDVDSGHISVGGDSGPNSTTTLADYASSHPGSTLVNNDNGQPDGGAIALVTGGNDLGDSDPQKNGEYDVDRVVVGKSNVDTLYDFGPNAESDGGTTRTTVDPDHPAGWKHQAYNNDVYLNSDQEFVPGPGTPPAGGGSLKFTLSNDTDANRVELFRTARYDDTLLRDVRTLDFSTYQRPMSGNATPQQPAYGRLSLDDDGNGTTDDTLFYYPANNGPVEQSTWQTWHAAADDAKWSVGGDAGPGSTVTLDQYLVAHPDATIVKNADSSAPDQPQGGVSFVVGGAGTSTQMNGEYFLDDITVGKVDAATGHTQTSDEFDLEPTAPAVSVHNARVDEGNHGATMEFPVTLDRTSGKDVTVSYQTSDGDAKAGDDYKASSGEVTIPAGEKKAVVTVPVISDKVREGTESFNLTLGSPGFGTVADGSAKGTIRDDDTRVGQQLQPATGNRVRVKVDTLPAAPGQPVDVYRVVDGKDVRVFDGKLNDLGRLNTVLDKQYQPGTRLTLYTTVETENGTYKSQRDTIVVG